MIELTKQFKVEIRELGTNDVIKTSVPTTLHKASKLEDAYDINLDHDKYYTAIVEYDKKERRVKSFKETTR